jgi:putative nucleotidyltransferase with HDIG domain
MTYANGQETIDVAALRVGMFIHLDGGWLSHPFPLSNFVVTTDEQIDRLRGLGLRQVRWSPALSEPPPVPVVVSPVDPAASAETGSADQAAAARRAALEDQRRRLALCDRQFIEATRAFKEVFDHAIDAPREAAETATRLADALTSKMLVADQICIRLLTEDAGDQATAHPINVGVLALLLGQRLKLGRADMADLGLGALLHDIGKIDLPIHAHQPIEGSNKSERQLYESHVSMGVARARRMGLGNGALLIVAQHHEMTDGSGFPRQLGGDRITPLAQVVALANRYDNLCNPERRAAALTPHEAMANLFAHGRHLFDPLVLETFIQMMGVYPPGSVVQLNDDSLAIVEAVNPLRPLKPRVLVYDPHVDAAEALHTDLDSNPQLAIRRSLKPKALPREVHQYLAPRRRLNYFADFGELLPAAA